MVKKTKVTKKVPETIADNSESDYSISDDDVVTKKDNKGPIHSDICTLDSEIMEGYTYNETTKRFPFYNNEFNLALSKIKALKELLLEEAMTEKANQMIMDSLAEKISEMIKKLE